VQENRISRKQAIGIAGNQEIMGFSMLDSTFGG